MVIGLWAEFALKICTSFIILKKRWQILFIETRVQISNMFYQREKYLKNKKEYLFMW